MPIRTDLVLETREMFAEEISGVESQQKDTDGITVTHVKITTPEGALKIGKPMGNYVTVEISNLETEDEELCKRGAKAVCDELKKMINLPPRASVLVAGLGNQYITPDSIGPKTVGKLTVTRHITKESGNGFDFGKGQGGKAVLCIQKQPVGSQDPAAGAVIVNDRHFLAGF